MVINQMLQILLQLLKFRNKSNPDLIFQQKMRAYCILSLSVTFSFVYPKQSNAQIGVTNFKGVDDYGNEQYHLPPGYIVINGVVMDTNHLMIQYKTPSATEYRYYQEDTGSEELNEEVQFSRPRYEAGWTYVIFEDPLEKHGTGHVVILNKIGGHPVNPAKNGRLQNGTLYKMHRIRVKDNFRESLEFMEYHHHDSNRRLDFGHQVPYSKIPSPYNYLSNPNEFAKPKHSAKLVSQDTGSNNIEDTDDETMSRSSAPFGFEDDSLKALEPNLFIPSDLTNDQVVKRDKTRQFDSTSALTSFNSKQASETMQYDAVAPITPLIETEQPDLIFGKIMGAQDEIPQQEQVTDTVSDQTATSPMVDDGSWNGSKNNNNILEQPNSDAYGSDSWNNTSSGDSLTQDEETDPENNQGSSLFDEDEQQVETTYNPPISTTGMQSQNPNPSTLDTLSPDWSSTTLSQSFSMENIDGRRFTRSIQPEEELETQTPPFDQPPTTTDATTYTTLKTSVTTPIPKKSIPLKIVPVKKQMLSLSLPNKADEDMLLKMIRAIVDSYNNFTYTAKEGSADIGYLSTLLAQKGVALRLNPATPTKRSVIISTESDSIETDMRKVTGKVIYIADRDGPLPYNENEPLLFTGSYFDM